MVTLESRAQLIINESCELNFRKVQPM